MAFITQAACNELISKSEFLFQNFEFLISLVFVFMIAFAWVVVYNNAESLSNHHGEKKIQGVLYNIVLVINYFCATMLVYILFFK